MTPKFLMGSALTAILMLGACEGKTPIAPQSGSEKPVSVDSIAKVDANVQRLIEVAQSSTLGYEIIESLTTEIGPRLAGTQAEARARDWGVAKFKELGFANVHIEDFTIPGWERGVETASIVTPYPQQLYITALGGSVATPAGGVTADVAYFPTFEALEAAPQGSLEGNIVYISGRMEKAPDGAGYGPANKKRRSGATEAAKRGAIAVLIRSVGTDSHRIPHTGQMRYADGVKKIPIAAMSGPDADQMDRILKSGQIMSVTLNLGPRATGDRPSGNVIGEIIGSEKPDEIVLIGGHIDSWDLGTGAIDDGAGIGITVAAAKLLMDSGLKPKRTIRVVMFGAEEVGLLGGFAYAKAHKDTDLAKHVLASESDFGSGHIYAVKPGKTPGTVKFASQLHKQIKGLDIDLSDEPSGGGPDIFPLNELGVPSVRLQQYGMDYFDLHHTPDDTFDKINADDVAQNVAAYAALI
ncbi:MAG: M20/M25/M40 family metallo-hydrolase, partial [Robiginitomaculum sp.]